MRIAALILRTIPVVLLPWLTIAIVRPASAATLTWNGGGGGLWEDPTQWLPQQTPGANDTAVIGGTQGTIVTVTGQHTVGSLVIGNPNATLRVVGTPHAVHGDLRVANGLQNHGTIELTSTNVGYAAFLTLTTGSLTNAPGGVIRVLEGSGGQRILNANLHNQGTLELDGDLSASGNIVNNGTVHLSPGRTLAISGTTTWAHRNGAITGSGTLSLPANSTFVLEDDFTPGSFALEAPGLTVNGPGRLLGPTTGEFVIRNWTINAPVVVTGDLVIEGTVNFNSALAVSAGKTMRVVGTPHAVHGDLRVANAFENHGTIELTSTNIGYAAFLTVTTGSLTNAPGGVIRVLEGSGGQRVLNANLHNQGTLELDGDLSASGNIVNNGTVHLPAGRTLAISGTTTWAHRNGAITGSGTLSLPANSTFVLEDDFTPGSFALEAPGLTVNGPGRLLGPATGEFVIRNWTINAPVVVTGDLVIEGTVNFNSALAVSAGKTLRVVGTPHAVHGDLRVANAFENHGTIELTSTNIGYAAVITVTTGSLTNAPGGIIRAREGSGGPRFLNANLHNQGRLLVLAGSTLDHNGVLHNAATGILGGGGTLNLAVATVTNEGAVAPGVSPGSLTVQGDLPWNPGARLHAEIAGFAAGTDHDQLVLSSAANLNGTIAVDLINGFFPRKDDAFTVLTYPSRTGGFSTLHNPLPERIAWEVRYNATSAQLVVLNTAPTLADMADQTINELTPLTVTASATDQDQPAQTLTYTLVTAPAGMTINASSGLISWTPSEAQGPGEFEVTVRAQDNGTPALGHTTTFSVRVLEVNVAPVLTLPAVGTVEEQTALIFTANATDADLPANTLTYELVSGPEGAIFNAATREFRWTPTEEQGPGTHNISLRVTDSGTPALAHTVSLSLTVSEVNQPPMLGAVSSATIHAGAGFRTSLTATDPDKPVNALTYSLVSGPNAATVTPAGRVDWTPPVASAGSVADFIVRVTDDGVPPRSDDVTFQVTVADPLMILETTRNGDEWTIRWRAVAGNTYRIMRTSSLPAAEWSAIPGEVTATGATATRTITLHPEAIASFLRVVLVE